METNTDHFAHAPLTTECMPQPEDFGPRTAKLAGQPVKPAPRTDLSETWASRLFAGEAF